MATAGVTPVALAQTESGHIAGAGDGDSAFRSEQESKYDVQPTGNTVNLEDEMMKVAANQMDYQAVSALYTRSLNLLKTALGKIADRLGSKVMDFLKSMAIAASGLRAQAGRMRIISENIANADSTPSTPGAEPYRRKIPTFYTEFDRTLDASTRRARAAAARQAPNSVSNTSPAIRPPTPTATSNIPTSIPMMEMTDMREAQRSYEANINVITATRRMLQRTIDILKA